MTDFNGSTTSHAYDAMDRLLSRTPDTSSGELPVTFGYNATGQRTMMTEGSGTTAYTYDGQSRLLRKDTPAGTLVYTYDLTGNRLSVASSNTNGVNVSYTHDELNRLKAVVDGRLPAGSNSTKYSYDAAGNLSETVLPNGVRITPGRDGVDRVTDLAITSTPAANYAYTYDRPATG